MFASNSSLLRIERSFVTLRDKGTVEIRLTLTSTTPSCWRLEVSVVGCAAQDDHKLRGQLTDLRVLQGLEIDAEQLLVKQAEAAAGDRVNLVPRVPGDIQ